MLITLKSFERIGNLTNKINVLQGSANPNRYYFEQVTTKKNTYLSDYTEEEANKVIQYLEEKISKIDKPVRKSYEKFYETASKTGNSSPIPRKRGVTNKTAIIIE